MFVGDGCYYGTIHIAVAARKYFSRMFVVTAVNWCTWVNVEQHLFLSFSFFVRVLDGVFFLVGAVGRVCCYSSDLERGPFLARSKLETRIRSKL